MACGAETKGGWDGGGTVCVVDDCSIDRLLVVGRSRCVGVHSRRGGCELVDPWVWVGLKMRVYRVGVAGAGKCRWVGVGWCKFEYEEWQRWWGVGWYGRVYGGLGG